jgi:hypothetical protein
MVWKRRGLNASGLREGNILTLLRKAESRRSGLFQCTPLTVAKYSEGG